MSFCKGDIVVCVDDSNTTNLTKGRQYRVEDFGPYCLKLKVKVTNGREIWFCAGRFKLLGHEPEYIYQTKFFTEDKYEGCDPIIEGALIDGDIILCEIPNGTKFPREVWIKDYFSYKLESKWPGRYVCTKGSVWVDVTPKKVPKTTKVTIGCKTYTVPIHKIGAIKEIIEYQKGDY